MLDAIAAGIITDQAVHHLNRITGQEQEPGNELQDILFHLRNIDEALNPSEAPNQTISFAIQPYPNSYPIPLHNRKHVCIFISSGAAGITGAYVPKSGQALLYLEIPGAGIHIRTVKAGWTQLDLPAGTYISTADGQTYPALLSLRNDPISDLIEEPLSALTMVASAATTGINADKTITFSGQAAQVMISNNSAGNILYEFDATSTAASDVLIPNQKLFVDSIGIKVVHVQAPVDTPINAAAGIVVRGWA